MTKETLTLGSKVVNHFGDVGVITKIHGDGYFSFRRDRNATRRDEMYHFSNITVVGAK